ncbi:hypothetical protein ACK3TF_002585 [Chlorella vulgaris]
MGGPVVATARGSSLQHTHINPVALGNRPVARRQPRAWCLRPVAAATDPAAWRDSFNRQASDARARLEEWARQQRLNERLRSGMDAARSAASMAGEQASRTARKVDQEYDVSGRAADVAQKAAEAAQTAAGAAQGVNNELESRFQFRRKTRNFFTDFKRRLPYMWRQVSEFSSTPMGAITFFFAFLVSVFTGAFWVILRLLFSVMWIGILCSPWLINYVNARMMKEQKARYREYAQEQQRRQQNPFAGTIFEELLGRGPKASGGKRVSLDSQDVIDVTYDRIYESD